jgi:GST-like protein
LSDRPEMAAGTPIELFGTKTGNCLRVSVALGEASLPYVVRRIDLVRGEHRTPAHIARNPAGKVPTIIIHSVGGHTLTLSQSNAILMYLADKAPAKLLPVGDPRRRASALERFFYFVTDVIAVSHAAFALRISGGDGTFLDRRSLAALELAETFLSDSRYMAGDDFTLADISAFTIALAYEAQLDWQRLPRMQGWFRDVAGRAAVQRGLHAFDHHVPA